MKIFKSIFYLFLPILIGGLVGFIIKDSIDYSNLIQPPFAPSKIIFPIAWSIIYLLMGLAYFIYRKKDNEFLEKFIYYLQLFVNAMWSIIFFVWKFRFFSIIWILLLVFLIILLMYLFSKKSKVSTYLLIPYILWLFFATYLNIGIYILN